MIICSIWIRFARGAGALAVLSYLLSTAMAEFRNEDWRRLGPSQNQTGVGPVFALAAKAGNEVYIAGDFAGSWAGTHNSVARWDGVSLYSLGDGLAQFGRIYPVVRTLAVNRNGHLIAGGDFDVAGGQPAAHIARWDGQAWSALGQGVNGAVNVLAVGPSNQVYVGGRFSRAGGVAARRIAQWNGTQWSALGSGMDSYVAALAVDQAGNLYAGGGFITAGGVAVNHVAKWNGQAWSALGEGMNAPVHALLIDSAGRLYAGGSFTTAGGVAARRIACWNGTAWSPVGEGMDAAVLALASDRTTNTLFAAGGFNAAGNREVQHVACWDGASWEPLGLGTSTAQGNGRSGNGWVNALLHVTPGDLYVGGHFAAAGYLYVNSIARAELASTNRWPTIEEALRAQTLAWTTGGSAPWFPVPNNTNGIVRSGAVLDNQRSWLRVTFTGAGTVRFKIGALCDTDSDDRLSLAIDGRKEGWSAGYGWLSWQSKVFNLTSGVHVIEWVFSKDASKTRDADAGFLSDFLWTPSGGPWAGAADLGNGWRWLSWFGYFNVTADPWIYHQQHGWQYVMGSDPAGFYLYDTGMQQWWWTSQSDYPSVYRFGTPPGWLYYLKDSVAPRWFKNFSTGAWERW